MGTTPDTVWHKRLIFATSNPHKLYEVRSISPPGLEIVGLKEIGFLGELPETRDTVEGNSLQKASHLWQLYGFPCFAEDTGLFVDALPGEPGVYSARYAGKNATYQENINKLLSKLAGVENRRAHFKTVITYYDRGEYVQFTGVTEGEITISPRGSSGFGYDPVFVPAGSSKTYAEMTLEEKNAFSHRKKSFDAFANFLFQNLV
ncbi:MAG: RdgB/HAM1 family non-canonical purine NTP pyrophosphatase [Chitinophagales bacterium]|nr:RdgB/HAM1 family non-canonical purine NTP pyrophosphatase [Chitinophagales bacterium]MDW8418745.1 RdgB/HAM1 family non-canonical purine NTP pyrophosphatase [Chitinophagales bacterium]